MISVGGLLKLTSIDFPEHLSAVIFCQGCNWRCNYCYNKSLQPFNSSSDALSKKNLSKPKEENDLNPQKRTSKYAATSEIEFQNNSNTLIAWSDVMNILRQRVGFIDGVVFSGGEPLLQKDLVGAILEVKELGFKVAIHTSGSVPNMMQKVLPLVNWIGFDVKSLFEDYELVTNIANSGVAAKASLEMLTNSGVQYETRTTIDPSFFTPEYVIKIATLLSSMGVSSFILQSYKVFNPTIEDKAFYIKQRNLYLNNADLIKTVQKYFPKFFIRG